MELSISAAPSEIIHATYHVYSNKELIALLSTLMDEARALEHYTYDANPILPRAVIYLATKRRRSVEGRKLDWCKCTVSLTLDTLDRMQRRVRAGKNKGFIAKLKTGAQLEKIKGLT